MISSYLLFALSERLFGVKLLGAIEILPWRPSRRVPLSYSYVEGILDYRGVIYPVYSLGHRLGLAKSGVMAGLSGEQLKAANKGKSIILLEENKLPFGIVVDSVLKMTKLEEQAPRERPQGIDPQFVKAFVYDQDREIMILDFERLFHAG